MPLLCKYISMLRFHGRNMRNLITGTPDPLQENLKLVKSLRKLIKSTTSSSKDGFTCIQIDCRINCNGSKNVKAYINKKTGIFICPACELTVMMSDVFTLYNEHASDDLKNNLRLKLKDKAAFTLKSQKFRPKDIANYVPASTDHLRNFGIILSEEILKQIDAKYDVNCKSLHFPLKNEAGIIVGQKILYRNKEERTVPQESCSGLLVYCNTRKKTQKAVVVQNIIDFLVLASQTLSEVDVICFPYFPKSLPQESLPYLEKYKQLIFWFDLRKKWWDASIHFAQKLDENRCLIIRPTNDEMSPFISLKNNRNLKNIISKARPIFHKYITTFGALKQDILYELQNIDKVNGVQWQRFPILNRLLKGHRKGELTILTGPTGCGKTTFMSEYSLDLALQGVTTLWGSFEIRNTKLAATLLRQYIGTNLDKNLEQFNMWAEKMEKLPMYFMTFHGQKSIKKVMETIEHAQYLHDIHHVIVDNVQFMLGISSSSKIDKFWEQDFVIAAFRAFATKQNVHVTLIMHPRKEKDGEELTISSILGSAKATQEADNVLIIQDKRLLSVKGKKYLQVAKNRYSGDLGIMHLEFHKDSLSYSKQIVKSGK